MLARGYSYTVIGGREMNQDASLVAEDVGLFALADGVGGGVGGEVASATAMETLKTMVSKPEDLKPAILEAQDKILKEALEKHGGPVMGTTATAVCINDDVAWLIHVGDSRCYLFRESHLELKTQDHEFYDEGLRATVLGSYLGIPTDQHPLQILEDSFELYPGDRLLFCSDGLYRQLDELRIVEILKGMNGEPELIAKTLCEEACLIPYSDNVTVVYVEIEEALPVEE